MGVPTESTAQKLEDEMLYINGVNTYNNTIQGASLWAMRKGFASVGVNDNDFIVGPEMMDGKGLVLNGQHGHLLFLGKYKP